MVIQKQVIRTNYVKHKSIRLVKVPCRLSGKKGESVQHLVSGCQKLPQNEYERRHGNVAKKIHWELCTKNGIEHTENWYEHVPEGAVENEEVGVVGYQCSVLRRDRDTEEDQA